MIDHSSCLGKKINTKGCRVISVHDAAPVGAVGRLAGFRRELHRCLTARADALFELADALLCGDTSMRSLVELSLADQHQRGHGSLYAALNRSRIDVELLRTNLAAIPVPRAEDGRIVLCHTYGRGKDTHIMIPGWP